MKTRTNTKRGTILAAIALGAAILLGQAMPSQAQTASASPAATTTSSSWHGGGGWHGGGHGGGCCGW
ncbi:MAG: hypothetical protein HY916_11325 [Desulfovibrio sp.]|nr:hypothetical protein [Desulfovibrio sp.]